MLKIISLFLLILSTQVAALEPTGHTVFSDGHPMRVWEKSATIPAAQILLLHGRTWSSLPDFDLQVAGEELSLMDGLVALGYRVYALDARGYGDTKRDESRWLTPDRAERDVANVIDWIREKSSADIHLFGWSYGSMVAQLYAQRNLSSLQSLILFGYPFDPELHLVSEDMEYPEMAPAQDNTAENAASDFITPGAISQRAIDTYVDAALKADPQRVDFRALHEWAELDPGKVGTPTLLLKGEFDPLATDALQAKLFFQLGTSDKWYVILPGGDHAALLETPRGKMLHSIDSFIRAQKR